MEFLSILRSLTAVWKISSIVHEEMRFLRLDMNNGSFYVAGVAEAKQIIKQAHCKMLKSRCK